MSSTFLMTAFGVLVAATLFFAWANWSTKRSYARSTAEDVVSAIQVLWEPGLMDEFELFLANRIDDPYLESVRLRCKTIYEQHDAQPCQYVTDEGARLLAEIRDEVKEHAERQRTTFSA